MMPVYNGEATLPRAVRSLLRQTYDNWYCIIVDDGSTDRTRELLAPLTGEPRFEIVRFSENRGRPYARQEALDRATGEYLAFLDADDFYHPEKLERQVGVIKASDTVDLVACANGSFDAGRALRTVRGKGEGKVSTYSGRERLIFAMRGCLIRLGTAKKVRFNLRLQHAQDTDYIHRYLIGRRYVVTDDVLYYYSEFESVDVLKILRTYRFAMVAAASRFREAPVWSIRAIASNAFKAGATTAVAPFVPDEFFLIRRGASPTPEEIRAYREALTGAEGADV